MRPCTSCRSSPMLSSAIRLRRAPSKLKGSVAKARTSASVLAATSATMAAVALPVPPPSPTTRMIKSMSPIMRAMALRSASAAALPISTSPPAPRPRVTERPITSFSAMGDWLSACTSVLIAARRTSPRSSNFRPSTAFVPAPPTPMILIFRSACAVAWPENVSVVISIFRSN